MEKQLALLALFFFFEALGSTVPWHLRTVAEDRICKPSEKGTLIPNYDCQKYWVCSSVGKIVEEGNCAPWFYHIIDDKSGECRPFDQVQCGLRKVSLTDVEKELKDVEKEQTLTPPLLSVDASEEQSSDMTWREQGNCAGQRNGKYNIPNQCKKFLTCQDDVAHVTSCPANLVFDEHINQPGFERCEYLRNTVRRDCSQLDTKSVGEDDAELGGLDGYLNVLPWMSELDCSALPDGKHPITNHCGLYYNCLGGKNVGAQQCPVGTAFEKRHATLEGDCFHGEEIARTDCAKKQYCETNGAGNHFTKDRACNRYIHCNSNKGLAQVHSCPNDTIFEFMNAHQELGCVNRESTTRAEC